MTTPENEQQVDDARVATLKEEIAECDALRERMGSILSRTAVALKGPEAPLSRHSWHDLESCALALVAQRDALQARLDAAVTEWGNKPENTPLKDRIARARAEFKKMEKNAARYLWLRDKMPFITLEEIATHPSCKWDDEIDAAMTKVEKS